MATIKDMFNQCIKDAISNAKMSQNPYEKAMCFAAIAQALASTGLIKSAAIDGVEPEIKDGKDSIKDPAPKATKPVKEVVVEPSNEPEDTVEPVQWTEEQLLEKGALIEAITAYEESRGEDFVMDCLSIYSGGKFTSLSDINASNIDDFISVIAAKDAKYDRVIELMGEFGEEAIIEAVKIYTSGAFDTLEAVSALNVDGFVEMIESLVSSAQ